MTKDRCAAAELRLCFTRLLPLLSSLPVGVSGNPAGSGHGRALHLSGITYTYNSPIQHSAINKAFSLNSSDKQLRAVPRSSAHCKHLGEVLLIQTERLISQHPMGPPWRRGGCAGAEGQGCTREGAPACRQPGIVESWLTMATRKGKDSASRAFRALAICRLALPESDSHGPAGAGGCRGKRMSTALPRGASRSRRG